MRNFFSSINYLSELSEPERTEKSEQMLTSIFASYNHKRIVNYPFSVIEMDDLSSLMLEMPHYVMNKNHFFVGKKFIDKARIVIADKTEILTGFKIEQRLNEETIFMVMPCVDKPPYFLINTEDWSIFYIEK